MGKVFVHPIPGESGGIGIEWTLLGERTVRVSVDKTTPSQRVAGFCETGAYPFVLIELKGENFSKTSNTWGNIYAGINNGPFVSFPDQVAVIPSFEAGFILLPQCMEEGTGAYRHNAPGTPNNVSEDSGLMISVSSSASYYHLVGNLTQRVYGGRFKF